jgi:hypothetical protein
MVIVLILDNTLLLYITLFIIQVTYLKSPQITQTQQYIPKSKRGRALHFMDQTQNLGNKVYKQSGQLYLQIGNLKVVKKENHNANQNYQEDAKWKWQQKACIPSICCCCNAS